MKCVEHVACRGDYENHTIVVGKPEGNGQFGDLGIGEMIILNVRM
jgi:hypothetical protein